MSINFTFLTPSGLHLFSPRLFLELSPPNSQVSIEWYTNSSQRSILSKWRPQTLSIIIPHRSDRFSAKPVLFFFISDLTHLLEYFELVVRRLNYFDGAISFFFMWLTTISHELGCNEISTTRRKIVFSTRYSIPIYSEAIPLFSHYHPPPHYHPLFLNEHWFGVWGFATYSLVIC